MLDGILGTVKWKVLQKLGLKIVREKKMAKALAKWSFRVRVFGWDWARERKKLPLRGQYLETPCLKLEDHFILTTPSWDGSER